MTGLNLSQLILTILKDLARSYGINDNFQNIEDAHLIFSESKDLRASLVTPVIKEYLLLISAYSEYTTIYKLYAIKNVLDKLSTFMLTT